MRTHVPATPESAPRALASDRIAAPGRIRASRHWLLLAVAISFVTVGVPQPSFGGQAGGGGGPVPGAARLLEGGGASEYWEAVAAFPTGHLVTARFLITNAGPGERSGVVVGHVVGPAGEVVKFRNGKAWGQWELTADGLRLEVGDSLLDLRGSPFRLVVDKGRARLDLRFAAAGVGPPPGIPSDVPGQGLELLTVATEVEASIQLRGMHQPIRTRGTGALIHGWAEREEFEGMVRRIDVLGMDENGPFYLVRTDHPDSPPRSWLVRVGGGDGPASVAEVGTLEDGRVGGAKPYPVPARLAIDAGGRVRGTVVLEPPLLEYDPLEDFSPPWRWLISLSSKPRRYWSRCRVELVATETAGAAAEPSAADGVAIITYFNPLP